MLGDDLPAPEATCVDVSSENDEATDPDKNNSTGDSNYQHLASKISSLVDEQSMSTNASKIDVYSVRQTRVPSHSPVPSTHVDELNTLNYQTQILSKIPEWMSCLPLIDLPRPIVRNTNGGAVANCRNPKKYNNNYKFRSASRSGGVQTMVVRNRANGNLPYRSPFRGWSWNRRPPSVRPVHHTKVWLEYLDFVRRATRN